MIKGVDIGDVIEIRMRGMIMRGRDGGLGIVKKRGDK